MMNCNDGKLDFIQDDQEFIDVSSLFYKHFETNLPFEQNPFSSAFKCFLGFDFDFSWDDDFYQGLLAFLRKQDANCLVFFGVEPSPFEYFDDFKKYNSVKIPVNVSLEDLNEIVTRAPVCDSVYSLALSSDVFALFSELESWAVLSSRYWELSIVGFVNEKTKQKFLDCFRSKGNDVMFVSVQEAVQDLVNFWTKVSGGGDVRDKYYLLRDKYQDRNCK